MQRSPCWRRSCTHPARTPRHGTRSPPSIIASALARKRCAATSDSCFSCRRIPKRPTSSATFSARTLTTNARSRAIARRYACGRTSPMRHATWARACRRSGGPARPWSSMADSCSARPEQPTSTSISATPSPTSATGRGRSRAIGKPWRSSRGALTSSSIWAARSTSRAGSTRPSPSTRTPSRSMPSPSRPTARSAPAWPNREKRKRRSSATGEASPSGTMPACGCDWRRCCRRSFSTSGASVPSWSTPFPSRS